MATTTRRPKRQKLERVPGIAAPIVKVCLGNAIKKLHSDPAWEHGRSSRTLAKYPDFRAVLMTMKAGTTMEEHKTEGSISVHTLTGRVRLSVEAENETALGLYRGHGFRPLLEWPHWTLPVPRG